MAKKQLTWKDAIIEALKILGEPSSSVDILETIREHELRAVSGATPQQTVESNLYDVLLKNGCVIKENTKWGTPNLWSLNNSSSPILKTDKQIKELKSEQEEAQLEQNGVIRNFGVFWERDKVNWSKPLILGQTVNGGDTIDFSEQVGVYVLYNDAKPIYVGQAGSPLKAKTDGGSLGQRLKAHSKGRLSSRWNKFSWFGFYNVAEDSQLIKEFSGKISMGAIISTLEAVMIEALETPLNRQAGQWLGGNEMVQVKDSSLDDDRLTTELYKLIQNRTLGRT